MYEWTHITAETGRAAQFAPDLVEAGVSSGLIEGTTVITHNGWQAVEHLRPGDQVKTLASGMQTVRDIEVQALWTGFADCPEDLWPICLPAGLIGNRSEILVLPEQAVQVSSAAVASGVLVPALALASVPGVERVLPMGMIEVIRPVFDEDQVVICDQDALFYCPANWNPLHRVLQGEKTAAVQVMGLRQAETLLQGMTRAATFLDRPVVFPPELAVDGAVNHVDKPVLTQVA